MMRVALAAVALLGLAAALGAHAPGTGAISGHVKLTTRIRGVAPPSNVYQPRAVALHSAEAAPEIRNVVVYLKGAPYAGELPVSRHEIRQEHEAFIPRVLAVTRGSTVSFPNGDPVFHNVFSLSSASTFDLGRYPMGRSKSTTFAKPGLVKVFCHIHSQMSASILVLDNPYFTVPELDGTFTLQGVPTGTYTIAGWHERVGERTGSVNVVAGQLVSVELSLPVEDRP